MKQEVSPAVVVIIVVVIVGVLGFFLWRSTGARTDTIKEPIDMGKAMKGGGGAPGTSGAPTPGGGMKMGGGAAPTGAAPAGSAGGS